MKQLYRVIRSIIMSAVVTAAGLWLILYVTLTLPPVQNYLCRLAETELHNILGTQITIGNISISPFNSILIKDFQLKDKKDREVIKIDKLGAGISLWRAIRDGRLDFTYAEIIGLDGNIIQENKDSALNIQFIIDAFKKEEKKEKSKFDLSIRHVVIRQSALTFKQLWKITDSDRFNISNLSIKSLNADVAIPKISNDIINIDIRRLAFCEKSGLTINKLAGNLCLSPQKATLNDFQLYLPGTQLHVPRISLSFPTPYNIKDAILSQTNRLTIDKSVVTPSDFACFLPALRFLNFPITTNLDLYGNLSTSINIKKLLLFSQSNLYVKAEGLVKNPMLFSKIQASFPVLNVKCSGKEMDKILESIAHINPNVGQYFSRLGFISADIPFKGSLNNIETNASITTALGTIIANGAIQLTKSHQISAKGNIEMRSFNLGTLLEDKRFGEISLIANVAGSIIDKEINGSGELQISDIRFNDETWRDIAINISKSGNHLKGEVNSNDAKALLHAQGEFEINNTQEWLANILLETTNLNFGLFKLSSTQSPYAFTGNISLNAHGKDIDNLLGRLEVSNAQFHRQDHSDLKIGDLTIDIAPNENDRVVNIDSKFLYGRIEGKLKLKNLTNTFKHLLAKAIPSFISMPTQLPPWLDPNIDNEDLTASLTIPANNPLPAYFNLPYRLLDNIKINAIIKESEGIAQINIHAPYLLQGKDKLITGTKANLTLDASANNYSLNAATTIPVKSNRMTLSFSANMLEDYAKANVSWLIDRKGSFKGNIGIESLISRNEFSKDPSITINVLPSNFDVNDTTWHINAATVNYFNKKLDVHGVKIWSGQQFAEIEGCGSTSDKDTIQLTLNDINLGYVFETLAINYVNFGGMATGRFYATSLFSLSPIAYTDCLDVKDFKYNGSTLGDAKIKSNWDNREQEVCIHADISENNKHVAYVDGGVFVTKDSLAFEMDADKVNIKFLSPFMEAFTSSVEGRASGKAHLYGTFSDIDLAARLYVDTITMKVDYTNVYYSGGSDSLIIQPGRINIDDFILHDSEGHTAKLNGVVKHHFFHEPTFEFRVTEARSLLCYNTDARINPDWYGHIYGNGSGVIIGKPGIVEIMIDMQTAPGSTFTFVLSDQELASEYNFLTFTDKNKKETSAVKPDTIPEILKYLKHHIEESSSPSIFNMNLRASVTPQAELIIVMDPVAGDKIKAYGSGNMQLEYSTDNDELSMHGKYTLDKGIYNFSLQDLILKTFTIRPGSFIAFNGDPYHANLGIDALYRVNTNLSDLDKSFSTDKDLNRTNVPVEAVLKVTGELQHPDITFDLELPTLTQDVARKVRSIISTDEMMNRQIIYLLALNRFYTPEYMGAENSNNELASFASTTLSSHLTNILGQFSPNWSVAPSIRTDAGDFSDTEVDLALSSSLLNNRLLLNGNFGYRDRSTSTTTFIGDFDLEYLLNKRGTLRLKAYNHYNDQNYYLKTALTTQGVGVVYKHDFDTWFNFLRRRKKQSKLQNVK